MPINDVYRIKPARIAHIIHNYKPLLGGGELYVQDLIQRLPSCWEQIVFQKQADASSPEVFSVDSGWLRFRSFRKSLQMKYFCKLCAQDILIYHDLNNFLHLFSTRSIGVCHGVNWRGSECKTKHNQRRKERARKAYKRSLGIVANDSDFFREMGVRVSGTTECGLQEMEERRWLLPNCVDTHLFQPGPPLEHLQKLNPILIPRRVSPERGIELAVEAFVHLAQKDKTLSLLVVGDVSDRQYVAQLCSKIEKLGLLGKVLFLGRVSRAQMAALYQSSRCTLIPTRHSEGTSLSALEAMACGCPTFSTAIGGLNDLPTEKVPLDPEGMGKAVAESMPHLDQLSYRQRTHVHKHFNLSIWESAWTNIIQTCLRQLL